MEKLTIKGTDSTPGVDFDPLKGSFDLKGRSFSENATEFYHPIMLWLEKYVEMPLERTQLSINIDLINSASLKYLLSLLSLLEGLQKKGKKVDAIWWFHEDDDETKEIGESLVNMTEIKLKVQPLPSSEE